MGSISKKIKNIDVNGVIEGMANKISGSMDDVAKQRAEICAECDSMVDEPIEELAINDKNIPEISRKMCNECGCSLPYLLRQNRKKCKLKKW